MLRLPNALCELLCAYCFGSQNSKHVVRAKHAIIPRSNVVSSLLLLFVGLQVRRQTAAQIYLQKEHIHKHSFKCKLHSSSVFMSYNERCVWRKFRGTKGKLGNFFSIVCSCLCTSLQPCVFDMSSHILFESLSLRLINNIFHFWKKKHTHTTPQNIRKYNASLFYS